MDGWMDTEPTKYGSNGLWPHFLFLKLICIHNHHTHTLARTGHRERVCGGRRGELLRRGPGAAARGDVRPQHQVRGLVRMIYLLFWLVKRGGLCLRASLTTTNTPSNPHPHSISCNKQLGHPGGEEHDGGRGAAEAALRAPAELPLAAQGHRRGVRRGRGDRLQDAHGGHLGQQPRGVGGRGRDVPARHHLLPPREQVRTLLGLAWRCPCLVSLLSGSSNHTTTTTTTMAPVPCS